MTQPTASHVHHPDLLRIIPIASRSVIEIGCKTGALAQAFKALNPDARYVGVDADSQALESAGQYCDQTHVASHGALDQAFYQSNDQHDCWVLGETLAQTEDPWQLLRDIHAVLPAGASVVACIPNAQHWSLQARLAIGDLRYEASGPLSTANIRWFTRETMLEMFTQAGFELVEGWPRTVNNDLSDTFVPLIGQMATAAGVDPEQAMSDALPLEYVVRAVPKGQVDVPAPMLTNEQFVLLDPQIPKDANSWVFPVCAYEHAFNGSERAVFECVKNDPRIRKVILTLDKEVQVDGVNVVVAPMRSREAQDLLLQSTYIFVRNLPIVNAPYPLDARLHRFINLWHGIALKRIGATSLDTQHNLPWLKSEHARCHAVIASSNIDRLTMAAAFQPLGFYDVWLTGLPRNDAILREESALPADFQEQLQRLHQELDGRRLVLFAPTFRIDQHNGYYSFTPQERQALFDCLEANNAVLGIREHMAATRFNYNQALRVDGAPILDLGRTAYVDIEMLYRSADLLITDYSSCFIDYMLTGKPQISFAYDLETYSSKERGLFFNIEDVFPGPICTTFADTLHHLDRALKGEVLESPELYRHKQKMFFEYVDDKSSERLVARIQQDMAQ